jgi:hypothetical protein
MLFARGDPSLIYAAVSGFGSGHVWEGGIGKKSWLDISDGLPDLPVNALVVDPLAADTLWAATDVGVYFRQGERRWTPLRAGMPPVAVQTLATAPGGAIQAGTYGRSAFELVRQTPFSTR